MKKSIFLFALSFLIFGCNYNHVKSADASGSENGLNQNLKMGSLDYQSLQLLVLQKQCVRCHSSAGGNQGSLNLETYAQVRAQMNKIYYRSIEKKDMPPSGLSNSDFDYLKSWLEAGAPEKNTSRSQGPIKGPITWDVIKKQVFASSCLDCHSGPHPEGHVILDQIDEVRKNISFIFDVSIIKQTMPLEPYAAMSEFEKQALMKWISQGMPN
jgi:uncharacterized membrane protein